MCATKRSSASWPSGETRLTTMSASPPYQQPCRQPGTGRPCPASVRARTAYSAAKPAAGAICSGSSARTG